MTGRINTYISILIITVAGAWAASLIVHIAYANSSEKIGNEVQYAELQRMILSQH